jgi:hypothetical protein
LVSCVEVHVNVSARKSDREEKIIYSYAVNL